MKKTKLFTCIAALALVLGLGACNGSSEEDVTPDESEGTTQSSETTGETTGGEEESKTTPAPEEGKYFLGFDVDGTVNYIDGGTVSGFNYEGTLTTNIGLAAPVTLAAADGDDAYYLTFDLDEATYYVCIIPVTSDKGTFIDLQYTTEANAIYWDETHAAWVNEEDTYFLCYNSTYKCAYASTFTDWWGSSPVGELFDIPEDWEPEEPEELPSSEVTYVGDVTEGTYKFGAFDTTSWSYLYISTGVSTASNHYLIPTSDWTYGANISITSYEDGYTLSYELGEETRYITYTGSSTAVTTSTQPYVWYYDSENAVFTSATENGRFLGLAENADAFRAYSYTNDGLTKYAHAIPYTTEPVPEENPNTGDEDPNLPGSDEGEFPYEVGETYWFGYEYNDALYAFTGAIASSNYGGVVTDTNGAASVTLGEAEGGYTLSVDDAGTTKYVAFSENNTYRNFALVEEAFVWEYNATYDTFVALDSTNDYVFIGNYYGAQTDHDELRISSIGYLDGSKSSSYTQLPSHLFAQDTPTALTITGGRESLYVGNTVKLGIEVANRANHDVTWSSSDPSCISVNTYGTIEALALAESVTITATSVKDENVTASIDIAVVEATQEEVELCSYDFSKKTDTNNSVRSTDQMMTIFSESFVAGEVTSNIVTSVTTADTIYAQAGGSSSNSNLQLSTACIKFGKSSTKGELAFTVSNTITKIELQAAGWSGSQPLTINGVQQSITQSAKDVESVDSLTTYTYEIEEATSIDIVTSERVLLFNMTFYGYL